MNAIKVYVGRPAVKLRKLADEELMGLVCHSEAAAFGIALERHIDAAFSLAYRMIGRRPLAEEVVQEALLSIWRNGARYDRSRGSVSSWILAVTHHRAVDALRREGLRTRKDVDEGDLYDRRDSPKRVETTRRDEAHEIRAALEQLPVDQIRVIELAYFGGFTHTEIAAMLDLPIGTVNDQMRLGLEELWSRLCPPEAVL
jgi:RNA polymerase sigma-70 factor (ECF subfamily)